MSAPPESKEIYVPYEKEDFEEIELLLQIDPKKLSVDRTPRKVFSELARTFVEEVLEHNFSRKRELTLDDLAMVIADKFPEISDRGVERSIEVLQSRANEINKENELS